LNKLRFIDESEFSGALNMAIDNYLAIGGRDSDFDFTLRLYRWSRPTLSCGFHQRIEKRVNLDKCRGLNIAVVRRPTGGRELMHDGDISFSITGRSVDMLDSDREIFRKAGRIIISGLSAIGINAQLSEAKKKDGFINQGPCLAAISQYEISVNGKKIVPIAQRVFRDSVLVHGSIPLRSPEIATPFLLNVDAPDEIQKSIESAATDIGQLIKGEINLERLKNALIIEFQESFRGDCIRFDLMREEIDKAVQTKKEWEIID
jgi:lipoate-protein ligase A